VILPKYPLSSSFILPNDKYYKNWVNDLIMLFFLFFAFFPIAKKNKFQPRILNYESRNIITLIKDYLSLLLFLLSLFHMPYHIKINKLEKVACILIKSILGILSIFYYQMELKDPLAKNLRNLLALVFYIYYLLMININEICNPKPAQLYNERILFFNKKTKSFIKERG